MNERSRAIDPAIRDFHRLSRARDRVPLDRAALDRVPLDRAAVSRARGARSLDRARRDASTCAAPKAPIRRTRGQRPTRGDTTATRARVATARRHVRRAQALRRGVRGEL